MNTQTYETYEHMKHNPQISNCKFKPKPQQVALPSQIPKSCTLSINLDNRNELIHAL